MNTPAPSAAPGSLALRVLRALLLLALCVVIALLTVLAAFALFNPFGSDDEAALRHAVRIALLCAATLPILLVWLAYRFRLRSWWWLGGGGLCVAPVLAYLAADDPVIRRPMSLEEIAPSFPGAEKSYAVLYRYGPDTPAAQALRSEKMWKFPQDDVEMVAYLQTNRAEIEAAWTNLASVRAWYEELNSFDRIGDLGEALTDSPVPYFLPHRVLSQAIRAKASLLALDGRGDEAIALAIPMLEIGRKLQLHSRTLVRSMIAMVGRNVALDTVEFVLKHAAVSPSMQARLHEALGPAAGEAGARRLVGIEYAYWTSGTILATVTRYDDLPAIARPPLRWVTPLLLNSNRTINEVGDYVAELQNLAARRLPLTTGQRAVGAGHMTIKNPFGRVLVTIGTPSYQKVVDGYWKQEDRLAALRERLAKT